MLPALIDKQDTFEIVRDQLASILVLEKQNQQRLAVESNRNPEDWDFRVYTERFNPYEDALNVVGNERVLPMVNIWYDVTVFDYSASNLIDCQQAGATYNIDCYGFGVATGDETGGHLPSDQNAAFETHRVLRLVRNILMSADNYQLQLRGTVGQRRVSSVRIFQVNGLDQRPIRSVLGARIVLEVSFVESSPQIESETLETLTVNTERVEDGEIVLTAQYDYT